MPIVVLLVRRPAVVSLLAAGGRRPVGPGHRRAIAAIAGLFDLGDGDLQTWIARDVIRGCTSDRHRLRTDRVVCPVSVTDRAECRLQPGGQYAIAWARRTTSREPGGHGHIDGTGVA